MTDFSPAFTAKVRIMTNQNRKSDKSPERNIVIDFTAEQAVLAANYLMSMAESCESERKTIRVYKDQESYTEVTGFSLWGGLWGDKGNFAPQKLESAPLPF